MASPPKARTVAKREGDRAADPGMTHMTETSPSPDWGALTGGVVWGAGGWLMFGINAVTH